MVTVNFINIRTPKKFVVITLKFELCGYTIEYWVQTMHTEWQDQTAPLIWVCTVCPGLSVRKLRIITSIFRSFDQQCQRICTCATRTTIEMLKKCCSGLEQTCTSSLMSLTHLFLINNTLTVRLAVIFPQKCQLKGDKWYSYRDKANNSSIWDASLGNLTSLWLWSYCKIGNGMMV